jgi:hypothetical protein
LAQDENYYTTVSKVEREAWNAKSNFSGNYSDLNGRPTFAAVATSGSYNDLLDKPTSLFAPVATSGSYNDLTDKPAIPTRLQDLAQDESFYTTVSRAEREFWNGKANISDIPTRLQDLAQDENYYTTVTKAERERWDAAAKASGFSGDYKDLINKPRLQDLQQDETYYTTVSKAERDAWNAKSTFSGSYADLANKPTIPAHLSDLEANEYYQTVSRGEKETWNSKVSQADLNDFITATERANWNTAAANATTAVTKTKLSDFDGNDDSKHYTVEEKTKLAGVAAGAEVNVNADWTATSGDAQILNKPTTLFSFSETEYSKHYTADEKTKLAGIAASAEVNVNADWSATSGDAQILNKPTLGTLAAKSSISNADVASDAAILASKISGLGTLAAKSSISNDDVASDAAILASKISGLGTLAAKSSISNADVADNAAISASKISGLGTLAAKSSISNADVASDAAILASKISGLGTLAAKSSISNDDVANNAAILASKISGLADVATSGSYDDLEDLPTLADVAKSGSYNDLKDLPTTIVTYTEDMSNNITFNKYPSLQISGGDNTSFGTLVENFIANSTTVQTSIMDALITAVQTRGSDLHEAVILAALPVGSIIMWDGDDTDLPCGWRRYSEMDGRFPVGASVTTETSAVNLGVYPLNHTGGENFHLLTVSEMPPHNHNLNIVLANSGTGNDWTIEQTYNTHQTNGSFVNSTGGGNTHENRPPYRAVYFIKKTSANCD